METGLKSLSEPTTVLPVDYQPARADRPLPVRYMPQLDGLRALAVVAVLFQHWGIKDLEGFRNVPWGDCGVWLFFVLSGFLITGILLRARVGVEASRASGGSGGAGGKRGTLWPAVRSFYARRFLRILPIYYITLFVTVLVLHMPGVRRVFWWHLTYTTNFRLAMQPHPAFPEQGGIHFWTLAVEEQFYLLWPAVILLVPRKRLVGAIFLTLIGGVAFRLACVLAGQRGGASVWPLGCFDLFAFGAALAAFGDDPRYQRAGVRFARWCGLLGGPALLALLVRAAWHHQTAGPVAGNLPVNLVLNSVAAGAVFAWLIAGAARGFGGVGKAVLEFEPLLFLGKISYGLYVYHNFMPTLFARLKVPEPSPELAMRLAPRLADWLDRAGALDAVCLWTRFGTRAAATITVATASWYLIEKPINGFKKYFEYAEPKRAANASSAGPCGAAPAPLPPAAPVPGAAGGKNPADFALA